MSLYLSHNFRFPDKDLDVTKCKLNAPFPRMGCFYDFTTLHPRIFPCCCFCFILHAYVQ